MCKYTAFVPYSYSYIHAYSNLEHTVLALPVVLNLNWLTLQCKESTQHSVFANAMLSKKRQFQGRCKKGRRLLPLLLSVSNIVFTRWVWQPPLVVCRRFARSLVHPCHKRYNRTRLPERSNTMLMIEPPGQKPYTAHDAATSSDISVTTAHANARSAIVLISADSARNALGN
jgi:hypothetical protein